MKLADNEKAKELWERYLAGNCTPEEQEFMEAWYDKVSQAKKPFQGKTDFAAIEKEIYRKFPLRKPILRFKYAWVSVAAMFLAAIITGIYFYYSRPTANDIAPGGNYATLTLADGTTVTLDSAQSGIIINDENIKYNNGNSVLAEKGRGSRAPGTYNVERTTYNSLTTPKGGQYQIILSDGTKVWLNAASSLAYPASFTSLKERRVRLTGEGYFEVAPDKSLPFRVETSNQEIEVVGTHFNVSSYQDEPQERTTLVEGAVIVTKGNDSERLNPGQEATIKDGIQVSKADVEAALAWQKGKFVFNDESLESIMRKVSRWYNVEIVYDGADKNELFGGSFSRYGNVSLVLKTLESTGGIHFKIEGRRITAMK